VCGPQPASRGSGQFGDATSIAASRSWEGALTYLSTASDGRHLAVDSVGAPDGVSVFLLHATPGSRSGPRPRSSVLYRLGVRLICYDRPGYGGSDRDRARSVADAASDVATIADSLNIRRFSVVGHASGGPHALACATLLRERVHSAAVLVGLAPWDAEGLDWTLGMTGSKVREYYDANTDISSLTASLIEQAEQARYDSEAMLRLLFPEFRSKAGSAVDDIVIRNQLIHSYSEAMRHGMDGWIDDTIALVRPWGFDLSSVVAPVLLWHGTDDELSPVSHSYWLAKRIDRAEIQVNTGAVHSDAVQALPGVLKWVKKHWIDELD
jgi:pimeloyl-ACP methyl ester carboxylesterase